VLDKNLHVWYLCKRLEGLPLSRFRPAKCCSKPTSKLATPCRQKACPVINEPLHGFTIFKRSYSPATPCECMMRSSRPWTCPNFRIARIFLKARPTNPHFAELICTQVRPCRIARQTGASVPLHYISTRRQRPTTKTRRGGSRTAPTLLPIAYCLLPAPLRFTPAKQRQAAHRQQADRCRLGNIVRAGGEILLDLAQAQYLVVDTGDGDVRIAVILMA